MLLSYVVQQQHWERKVVVCPDTHTLRTAHTPWFGGNRRHTLFTGYEPKCNGSQTFTDEKRSTNADSSRRKYLKKYDEQCNQAQSTPSGRFTKVKERGAVDMRKRKQEQQKNNCNVLRKKPEQTTNEHERNMSRYNKQKSMRERQPARGRGASLPGQCAIFKANNGCLRAAKLNRS